MPAAPIHDLARLWRKSIVTRLLECFSRVPAALESMVWRVFGAKVSWYACGAKIVWGAFGAKMVGGEGGEDLVETAIFKSAYLKSGRSLENTVSYKNIELVLNYIMQIYLSMWNCTVERCGFFVDFR